MKSRAKVHFTTARTSQVLRGVHGARTRCGQWAHGLSWTRDPEKVTCRRCIEQIAATERGCLCGHPDHESATCLVPLCGCLYTPLSDLVHWVELEVIWQRWGVFYYETREQMWRGRIMRPLFPVALALGAPGTWLTAHYEPPPAIRADVAQIRADFRARTGKELSL
jgi:hypothetical protein